MITHINDSHQVPRKVIIRQSYKFKKIAKNLNLEMLQGTLHATVTYRLKLLDNMYKYEMDPTRTLGTTERTQDAGQMDGWTDRRMDRRAKWNQYTRQQLRCAGDMITLCPSYDI